MEETILGCSSFSPSSSSSSSWWKYDVFLSCSIDDASKNFTQQLYTSLTRNGINTFWDNQTLEKGEELAPAELVISAIKQSWGSIIVLSKGYAFSGWCLDELAEIVKQKKERGYQVYLVFYDVDSPELRTQRGIVGEAFAKHEVRYKENKEKTQRWRDALLEIAKIRGEWCLRDSGEEEVIGGMVEWIKSHKDKKGKSSCKIPSPRIFRNRFLALKFQKPELVSIGPYHRDEEEHRLDKYKLSFMEKLLSRTSNNRERDLSFYVGEIISLEEQARACYSEDLAMSSYDFDKMMLVDGCFIIELLRHFCANEDDLVLEDPINNIIMPWHIPILVHDLLLLENQIPFFVLEKLFDLSKNHDDKPELPLTTMALKFFDQAFPLYFDLASEQFTLLEPNHLLDLFVKTILTSNLLLPANRGKWNISRLFFKYSDLLIQFRSSDLQDLLVKHDQENESIVWLEKGIAEHREACIQFKPSTANSFLDFSFKDGILKIPVVTINNLFGTIVANSMALENSSPDISPRPFNGYIYFMSCLIKEASDVKFLCSKGIISGFSDTDKGVADLFNLLRRYASPADSDSHLWKTIRAMQCYNWQSSASFRWKLR